MGNLGNTFNHNVWTNGVRVNNLWDFIMLPSQFSFTRGIANKNTGVNNNGAPTKSSGWYSDLFGVGKKYNNNNNLSNWFRDYVSQQNIDEATSNYLKSLSNSELAGILNEYWSKASSGWGQTNYAFDADSALKELRSLSAMNLPEPSKSYEDIWNEADARIDAENAQAAALYDKALDSQVSLYNSQMGDLNRNYNDYAKQVLAMDYQKNNQLLSSLGNNMNKARQNALEAGASAGVRLANNVNTLLSTQNKQAQSSLETSNQLAQMLMNQRNAAMGLQSNIANAYSNNANQKAGLIQGTLERKQNYADSSWNQYQQSYDDKVNRATASLEGSAFKDSYLKYKQGQQTSGSNAYA